MKIDKIHVYLVVILGYIVIRIYLNKTLGALNFIYKENYLRMTIQNLVSYSDIKYKCHVEILQHNNDFNSLSSQMNILFSYKIVFVEYTNHVTSKTK